MLPLAILFLFGLVRDLTFLYFVRFLVFLEMCLLLALPKCNEVVKDNCGLKYILFWAKRIYIFTFYVFIFLFYILLELDIYFARYTSIEFYSLEHWICWVLIFWYTLNYDCTHIILLSFLYLLSVKKSIYNKIKILHNYQKNNT